MRKFNAGTGRYEYVPDQRGVSPQTVRYERGTERGAPLGNERTPKNGVGDGGVSPQTVRYERGTERGAPLGNERTPKNGVGDGGSASRQRGDRDNRSTRNAPPSRQNSHGGSPPTSEVLGALQKTLSNLFSQGFQNEDLLLFAVLFLMYQETGDKELLIIMGGMFLL